MEDEPIPIELVMTETEWRVVISALAYAANFMGDKGTRKAMNEAVKQIDDALKQDDAE